MRSLPNSNWTDFARQAADRYFYAAIYTLKLFCGNQKS